MSPHDRIGSQSSLAGSTAPWTGARLAGLLVALVAVLPLACAGAPTHGGRQSNEYVVMPGGSHARPATPAQRPTPPAAAAHSPRIFDVAPRPARQADPASPPPQQVRPTHGTVGSGPVLFDSDARSRPGSPEVDRSSARTTPRGDTAHSSGDSHSPGSIFDVPHAPRPGTVAGQSRGPRPRYAEASQVTLLRPARRPTARDVLVIDPGHGGTDPGAIANGMQEKEIALDVSLRLEWYLKEAGFSVVMTRNDDSYPTLRERVDLTRRSNAILFLSVHANAASRAEARGVETFFWNRGDHRVAARRLATAVQGRLMEVAPTLDRGAKHPDHKAIAVLRDAPCPAALAELGFMTNEQDAAYLRDPQMREDLARALFNGIVTYFNALR